MRKGDGTWPLCRTVWRKRTNRVVFQHAQRLMRARPLHCAVVASHGHRDEAHHDGTRLRCGCLVSTVLDAAQEEGRIRRGAMCVSLLTLQPEVAVGGA